MKFFISMYKTTQLVMKKTNVLSETKHTTQNTKIKKEHFFNILKNIDYYTCIENRKVLVFRKQISQEEQI